LRPNTASQHNVVQLTCTSASVRLSSALVASSRMMMGGFFSRVRAIDTRCRSPPALQHTASSARVQAGKRHGRPAEVIHAPDSFNPRSPTRVLYPSGSLAMKSVSCARCQRRHKREHSPPRRARQTRHMHCVPLRRPPSHCAWRWDGRKGCCTLRATTGKRMVSSTPAQRARPAACRTDRLVEEHRVLRHHTDVLPQRQLCHVLNVLTVDKNGARGDLHSTPRRHSQKHKRWMNYTRYSGLTPPYIIKSEEQPRYRRFAAARLSYDGSRRACLHLEGRVGEHDARHRCRRVDGLLRGSAAGASTRTSDRATARGRGSRGTAKPKARCKRVDATRRRLGAALVSRLAALVNHCHHLCRATRARGLSGGRAQQRWTRRRTVTARRRLTCGYANVTLLNVIVAPRLPTSCRASHNTNAVEQEQRAMQATNTAAPSAARRSACPQRQASPCHTTTTRTSHAVPPNTRRAVAVRDSRYRRADEQTSSDAMSMPVQKVREVCNAGPRVHDHGVDGAQERQRSENLRARMRCRLCAQLACTHANNDACATCTTNALNVTNWAMLSLPWLTS
jgi:hypothetical protein